MKNKQPTAYGHRKTSYSRRKGASPQRTLYKRFFLHPLWLFGLLCAGAVLVNATRSSMADTYSVHAFVPASSLTEPAVIDAVGLPQPVTTLPLAVTGTCPDNSYVILTRNGLFSGVATCQAGTFTIATDLFAGSNQLVAQDYNVTDEAGPASEPVTVAYVPPAQPSPSSGSASPSSAYPPAEPLILSASFRYRLFQVREDLQWGIGISGGTAPYEVQVAWDKGDASQMYHEGVGTFIISHAYLAPGNHVITVQAQDTKGVSTTLQLVAIVEGAVPGGAAANQSAATFHSMGLSPAWLWVAWSSYGTLVLMAVSFWLGEHEEYLALLGMPRRRQLRH